MLYIHFFRNVTKKPQINKFKIFRKCFVLPGYKRTSLPTNCVSEPAVVHVYNSQSQKNTKKKLHKIHEIHIKKHKIHTVP